MKVLLDPSVLVPAIAPGQARRLIEKNIVAAASEMIELGGEECHSVLQRMTGLGLENGAVCDAL